MNLIDLCARFKITPLSELTIPSYLLGAFRRKSITFSNGLTDEQTIVYWFQTKTFTIDLRLKDPATTPVLERQGWIGDTVWDQDTQLLSWNITANYQHHIQWPEPAKLHAIGNAIFEFSPSNAYVEDWRQQATQGLYLGLRLFKIENIEQQKSYAADGGIIICDHFIAYAKTRHSDIQRHINEHIQNFEVSISLNNQTIDFSTVTHHLGQKIDLDHFEIVDGYTLVQHQTIDGEKCRLYFRLDIYQPDFIFTTKSETSIASQHWLDQEKSHLLHHAKITL
nr:hypothetical protein [Acinetobacter sp. Marseille-Q1620]